jgi:hypothetical protein
MRKNARRLLILAVALCFWTAASWAQEFRGTITGRVLDSQQAAVPNVRVLATQVETGAKYETVSSGDGQYTLPFLAPGVYRVTVEASGFKRFVREGVRVSTNERQNLDVALEVGGVSETITVTAETSLLETATASTGQVINQRQIDSTPLNGRSPLVLAQLAFGVVPNASANQARPYDDGRQSTFSMGGAPAGKNELLLDGAPDNNQPGNIAFSPPVDSVQEVKVESFQADAAYGHTGGGTVHLVTKSGTNSFHGSAYEFNQVSRLAATQFFTNAAGQTKAVTRYNQWGMTTGGPVAIPKVYNGRSRVFFFFAYEGIKTGLPQPNTLTVPTAAERSGDFSKLLSVSGNYQLYDPATGVQQGSRVQRQPFAGNTIPANRISPIAKNILGYYGLPNQAGGSDGQSNYLANTITDDHYDSETGRVDFNLTARSKLFLNLRRNDRLNLKGNQFTNIASGTSANSFNAGGMLDYVYTITPTMVLNTRFNWGRSGEHRGTTSNGFDFTQLGFAPALLAASARPYFPSIAPSNFSGLGSGSHLDSPYDTFQLFSSVTKITGRHSLKIGADVRVVRYDLFDVGNASGKYNFNNNWANGPLDNSPAAPLGQDLAALLLGLPTGGGFDLNASQASQAAYYALFLQDDIRVTGSLTLNLGLRYERDLPTHERFNRTVSGFDFAAPSPISAAAIAAYTRSPVPQIPVSQFRVQGGLTFASPQNRDLYTTGAHNFSPRFGFAWKPPALGGKTVIRGGTGVFFYALNMRGIYQTGFSQTTSIVPTLNGYLTPSATLANPFPTGMQQPTGSSLGLATYLGNGVTFETPGQRNPYSVRWNLDLQRELPGRMVVEASYFGNHAVHLSADRQLDFIPAQFLSTLPVRDNNTINLLSANVTNPFLNLIPGASLNGSTTRLQQLVQPFPQFTGVTSADYPEGSSYFHMLQARFEKRFSHGFQFLANYQFSKLMEQAKRLNDSDPFLEKRIGADDRPQRLVLSTSWELPFGKGKAVASSAGPLLDRLIGGWIFTPVYVFQPGPPLKWGNVIYYGGDLHLDSRGVDGAFDVTRFNTSSKDQLASNIRTFPSQFGNLRADGINNIDFSMVKKTHIAERFTLEYRCEFFNALNHVQFDTPDVSPTDSGFSRITSQSNLSRSIQMALRLVW